MADQAAPKTPTPVLTPRDQELMVIALRCLEDGEIKIDYAKFATEGVFKDKSVARTKWSQIKSKLDKGAKPAITAASGAATKATAPKTPPKPKEPKEPKTTASTSKKAMKSTPTSGEDEGDATSESEVGSSEVKMEVDPNGLNSTASSAHVKAEADNISTAKDADGDSNMVDNPDSSSKDKDKRSVADDMSTGDMSPPATPAPTKGKKAATATPKPKAEPKTPKTPKTPTSEAINTELNGTAETPVRGSSAAKKRGRKTNAQKAAEVAAAGENGAADSGEGDEEQKPAKKARKTPVKKVLKEAAAAVVDGENGVKKTPNKTPRKTAVKNPKESGVEDGDGTNADADNVENKTEKPVKTPRKAPVKKEKEDAAPAGEGIKLKKKPEPKPAPKPAAAATAKEAVAVALSNAEATDEEAEEIDQEAIAKVTEAAELANAVLDGKKIGTKITTTTDATVPRRNWGTALNGNSAGLITGQITAVDTTNTTPEADSHTIVVGAEIVNSIETDNNDEASDTIVLASE